MFTLEFLNAKYGDSFLVRWGTPNGRVMLVDGGPAGVYETVLKQRLLQLPADGAGIRTIDVVCLSHIDDDHAVGLKRLLGEMRRQQQDNSVGPFAVKRLWFNSVDELLDYKSPGLSASVQALVDDAAAYSSAVKAGYTTGGNIRDAAVALGLHGNPPFGTPLTEGAATTLNDDLHVSIVAPDREALDKLEKYWRLAQTKRDPDVIAQAFKDYKVPNLSSIVLLLEYKSRTALLTGDARGDRILAGLRATKRLTDSGPLHVGLLKLPHHGSDRNVDADFFSHVHADHYVISANGTYGHPSVDTLRILVESRDRDDDDYTIHLTNEITPAAKALSELKENRNFKVEVRQASQSAIIIEVGDQP